MNKNNKQTIFSVIKSALVAVAVTFALVFIFAMVLNYSSISSSVILPVNQVIKVLSILVAAFVLFKKVSSRGILLGALLGVCYTVLSYFVFSVIDGTFNFSSGFFMEVVFSLVIGAICGVIAMNTTKSKNI